MEIICPAIEFMDDNGALQNRRGNRYEEIVQLIRDEGFGESFDRWHTNGYMVKIGGMTMFVNKTVVASCIQMPS